MPDGDRPRLSSAAVELTARCNLRCAHCYNPTHGEAEPVGRVELVLARVTKLLDVFDVGHLTLTGGEPLAFDGLDRLLALLQGRGAKAQVISNGTLVDDERARGLAARGVRGVQVSLHGPDAARHDALVGARMFERARTGVRALLAHGVSVVGCVVVSRLNAADVGGILELWSSLGVRRVALSRFSPAGLAASQVARLLPSLGEVEGAFDQALPFAREGRMEIFCTMPMPPCAFEAGRYAPIRFGTCAIGTSKQELALGTDGRLRSCTLHRTALAGGRDILAPDFDARAALESPELTRYRSELPAFCEGCLHAPTCIGGCGAASDWVLGDARRTPDPLVWQHVDDAFAGRLAAARSQGPR